MAIKWRKKDTETLTKLVRNYNAKIKRLENKGYDKGLLPEKQTMKGLKKKITTRDEFNTEVELMKVFTARYSENINKMSRGAQIPTFAMKQSKIKIDAINKKRKEQRKKIENFDVRDRDKKLGGKVKAYKEGDLPQFKERKFKPENMSKKDFEFFKGTLVEYDKSIEQKNKVYVDNFYKSIHNVFGLGLSEEHEKKLLKLLEGVTDEEIVMKYYTDINMNIELHYNDLELESRYDIVVDSWKDYIKRTKGVKEK